MAVSSTYCYTEKVPNVKLCGFWEFLLRWKGSVYKLIYKEIIIYIILYIIIALLYHLFLQNDNKIQFEKLCIDLQQYAENYPVIFVLGFYLTRVVKRWWSLKKKLPTPNLFITLVVGAVHGNDERSKLLRRTLLRYLNLAEVLTYRMVSKKVRKKYPTIQSLVDSGFLLPGEQQQYKHRLDTEDQPYLIPLAMFSRLLHKIHQKKRINDVTFNQLLKEFSVYQGCCASLLNSVWDIIPLACSQMVIIAVYMSLLAKLFSNQYLDVTAEGHPWLVGHICARALFTIGEFVLYLGWFKVAEQLINPFGDDDDDFDVEACIKKNHDRSMRSANRVQFADDEPECDLFSEPPAVPVSVTFDVTSVSGDGEADDDVALAGGANQNDVTTVNRQQYQETSRHTDGDDVIDNGGASTIGGNENGLPMESQRDPNENDKLLADFPMGGGSGENRPISRKRFVGDDQEAGKIVKPRNLGKSNIGGSTTSDVNRREGRDGSRMKSERQTRLSSENRSPQVHHPQNRTSTGITSSCKIAQGIEDTPTGSSVGGTTDAPTILTARSSRKRRNLANESPPRAPSCVITITPHGEFPKQSTSSGSEPFSRPPLGRKMVPGSGDPETSSSALGSVNRVGKHAEMKAVLLKTTSAAGGSQGALTKAPPEPKVAQRKPNVSPQTAFKKALIPPKALNQASLASNALNKSNIASKPPTKAPVTMKAQNEEYPCGSKAPNNFEEVKKSEGLKKTASKEPLRRISSASDWPD